MSDWIEDYTRWAYKRSPLSPRHFHQNIALTVVAGAVAGRCFVQLPQEEVYPNLYTLLVARTSVFAKTTSLNLARRLVRDVMPEKVFGSIGSPEALFDHLGGMMPTNYDDLKKEDKEKLKTASKWGGRRLFILDEAGLFFNTLTRDYNSNMAEHFMALYDANEPIEHTTRGRGQVIIKHPMMSALFATTPYSIRTLLSQRAFWMNGFWARWNFVSALELTEWQEGQYVACPAQLRGGLQQINSGWLSQYNDKPYSMPIDTQVMRQYAKATESIRKEIINSQDERFDGLVSRLVTKHLKAAMLYAILDTPQEKPRLKLCHWEKAAPLVNDWHVEAKRVLELSHQSEKIEDEEKVLNYVRAYEPQGVTARRLQQLTHKPADEMGKLIETLKKMGILYPTERGRTVYWRVSEEKDQPKFRVSPDV